MKKLQEIRKLRKLTQQKLADKIGVARSTLAMWETSDTEPPNDTLVALADALGVTTDDLLGRKTVDVQSEQDKLIEEYIALLDDPADAEILKQYAKLDKGGKKVIQTLVRSLIEQEAQEKEKE